MRPAARSLLASLLLAVSGCDCGEGNALHMVVPAIVVTPTALDFGQVPLHAERFLELSVSNQGDAELHLGAIDVAAPFETTSTTPLVIPPGVTIAIEAGFLASTIGAASGTLSISSDDPKNPTVSVALSANGLPGDIEMIPREVDFHVAVHTASSATITVINRAGSALTADLKPAGFTRPEHFSLTGLASFSNGAPLAVPATAQRALTLDYHPSEGGRDDGRVQLLTCGERCGPAVRVRALAATNALVAQPAIIDFGTLGIGFRKQATVIIRNEGDGPATITAGAITGLASDMVHLEPMPQLPVDVAAHNIVALLITYAPQVESALSAVLTLSTNAPGQPRLNVALDGAAEGAHLIAQPERIDFGVVEPMRSFRRLFLIVNDGAGDAMVDASALSGDPSITLTPPALPATLGGGESLSFAVDFVAPAVGTYSATVTVTPADHAIPALRVPIRAVAAERICVLDVQPTRLHFGLVTPTSTHTMTATVTNAGSMPCVITGATFRVPVSPSVSTATLSWPLTLPPNASLPLSFRYAPATEEELRAIYQLDVSDPIDPHLAIEVLGSAHSLAPQDGGVPSAPALCVDPRALVFGSMAGDQSFSVRSCGTGAITVSSIAFTLGAGEFTIPAPPATPLTLPAGMSTMVDVHFTPGRPRAAARITVTATDPRIAPVDVNLSAGDVAPTVAGRFLYFWQIGPSGGTIRRLSLQGPPLVEDIYGGNRSNGCVGCHTLSPDGHYLAVVSHVGFQLHLVDTMTKAEVALPFLAQGVQKVSWRPNINTVPPYQFAFDSADDVIKIGSLSGVIRVLRGADVPGSFNRQPSWGSTGKIAFTRDACISTGIMNCYSTVVGTGPTTDLLVVDENGGVPTLVPGASSNATLNYYPEWSPNGRWIAFTQATPNSKVPPSYAAPDAALRLAAGDLSGTVLPLLNVNGPPGTASSAPTWSVDGSYLSFSSNRASGGLDWDLFYAPIDPATGVAQQPLPIVPTNSNNFEHGALWSP